MPVPLPLAGFRITRRPRSTPGRKKLKPEQITLRASADLGDEIGYRTHTEDAAGPPRERPPSIRPSTACPDFYVSSTSVTLGGPTVAFSRAALNRLAYATRLHLFRLISPSNVPSPVTLPPGAKSIVSNSIIVNVPVAPANRPVPFSIVATFVSLALFGGMKTP